MQLEKIDNLKEEKIKKISPTSNKKSIEKKLEKI